MESISLSKSPELLANNLGIVGFKFSNKWLDGFLGRYNLSERHKITVAQQLPLDLIEKQNIFLSYIMYLRIHNKYKLKYIGNIDEMPMWFNLPNNTTINQKKAKTVSICTIGHEQSSFTVILVCMADGMKLPAICIFKLKNILKEKFPYGIYIRVNEKGWVNKQEMLCRKNTNIAMISSSCTSKLQPLNIAINKNFKSKVKDRYNNWMISNIHAFTPAGKIKRPFYLTVTIWVKELWDEVDENLIQRSFKSCGILTNIDSSEDDCIFDHNSLLNRDNKVLKNLNNSTDENYEEKYSEEINYKNKWDIKVVVEVNRKDNDDKSESEKEKDDGNDDYQDSDDHEEMRHRLNELKKLYKH
ncbi:unnamed protein product [Rhizophagus irregularis]|nr:unnamed protein product [Rhizophagus irregularis]